MIKKYLYLADVKNLIAMENNFLCPKCNGFLNIGSRIVFSVRNNKNQRGLIFLSSEVGDYSVTYNPGFSVETGELLEFICPLCNARLHTPEINENLAKILMVDEMKNITNIVFSQIKGEKCTYKISGSNIESYGKDAAFYLGYFNIVKFN